MPRAMSTVAVLVSRIEQRLYASAPDAVRRAAQTSKSPLWCCALVFDASLVVLPPELAVMTLAEREATLRKHGPKLGRTLIWKCTMYDGMSAAWFEDRALDAACAEVEERITGTRLSRLLVRVARKLNALPRARFGNVTDDFVVYAFDRNAPTKKLVEPSLTAKQRALYRDRGLV